MMKIEVFDLLEFQIMAAARQMKCYYGFPADHEPQPEEVRYAVYQMTRRGVFRQEGEDLVMQEPVSGYMNAIAASKSLMIIDRGGYTLPRQCIYHEEGQNRYICLENSSTAVDQIGLSALDEDELFCQMEDLNQLPDQRSADELGEQDLLLYWERHQPDFLQILLDRGLAAETEELLKQQQIHTVFSDRDKRTGALLERLVILNLPLGYGQLIQRAGGNAKLQVYEQESTKAVLKDWWRK